MRSPDFDEPLARDQAPETSDTGGNPEDNNPTEEEAYTATEQSIANPEGTDKQSWEGFEDEEEDEANAVGEPPKSAFSDSSDEETPEKPEVPERPEIDEEHLWSDEETQHTPSPRPATPLAPSKLEKELRSQRDPNHTDAEENCERNERHLKRGRYMYSQEDGSKEQILRPFSGHQSDSYDHFGGVEQNLKYGERSQDPSITPMPDIYEKRKTKWKAGESGLRNATAVSPTSPEAKKPTDGAVNVVWADADEVDWSDGEIEDSSHVADAAAGDRTNAVTANEEDPEYSDSDYGDDEVDNSASAVAEHSEMVREAGDESRTADGPSDEQDQADQDHRDNSEEDLVESYLNREDDDSAETPKESSMGLVPYAQGHGAEPTTPELEESSTRPSSPINQFRSDVSPEDPEYTLEQEFDGLARYDINNPPKYPPMVGEGANKNGNAESSETPKTPTSAEILADITDMSVEDGTYRFQRLTELAESNVMRDPRRALEMKRQMLLYRHGHESDKISRIGEEGAKISKKASDAWKSAAVHGYRHEREEARKEAKWYEARAKYEYDLNQANENELHRSAQANWSLNQQLAEAHEEIEGYETTAVLKEEELRQSQEKLRESEEEHESTREKLRASQQNESMIRKEYLTTAKSFVEMKKKWNAYTSKDAETQTSPAPSPINETRSKQQTEKSSDSENAGKDADTETESTISSDDEDAPTPPSVHKGTQTLPVRIADQSQDNMLGGNRSAVPLLRFEIASDIQDRLVGEMVDFINAAHARENTDETDDSGETVTTAERVTALLSARPTYSDFVSALRNDGLLFREDHLAQRLLDRIGDEIVPLALLQQRYPITARGTYQDVERVYTEMAERDDEIRALQSRINTAPPAYNTDDSASAALMASLREITAEKEDLEAEVKKLKDEKANSKDEAQNGASITTGQNETQKKDIWIQQLAYKNAELQSTINDLEHALKQVSEAYDEASNAAQKPAEDKNVEKVGKLEKDLGQCRQDGEQLQLALDEKDSEIDQLTAGNGILNDGLRACREKCEELEKEIASLRRENFRNIDRITELQDELGLLPPGLDEDGNEEGSKPEDDERANLRKEIEKLRADNKSLRTDNDLLTADNNALLASNSELIAANSQLKNAAEEKPEHRDLQLQIKQLESDKKALEGENKRYKVVLNQAAQASMQMDRIAQTLPPATQPPAPPQRLPTPTAAAMPPTPAPLPNTPSAHPHHNPSSTHLLRPTDVTTPRTPALSPFNAPVNESMLQRRWVERERRIQSSPRWKADVERILAKIENEEYFGDLRRRVGRGVKAHAVVAAAG